LAASQAGRARLERGDNDGAIALFDIAHSKGPHFADALEMWGEALMAKADFSGAVEKFIEADRFAPNWGRNHLRWGLALARLGRQDDAKRQFSAASGLDLSASDRSMLERAAGIPIR
jgi:Flp pilus assembly protein TadD